MGALFGLLTSLSIGTSDLFGRRVVTRCHVLSAMIVFQGAAALVSLALLPIIGGSFAGGDFGRGLASGLGLGAGLALYYTSLDRAGSAIAAPIVATLSAVIPFAYTALRGHDPPLVGIIGAAVAFGGLGLVTAGGTRGAHVVAGTVWATLSGLGYGVGLSVLVDLSESSGAWPGLGQRLASVTLMAAVVAIRGLPALPPPDVFGFALLTGLASAAATIFYIVGIWFDPPATVVGASMFPVMSVMVGRFAYQDALNARQGIGIVAAVAGVTAVVAA
ncbi:MAG: EamA family transporter [Acidimicrobiaceae bacterium]|nr:EamA family transporter [Acidimicrobiaceae bacterium]MDE0320050.1 EamA family transporter [Acidimicrobiaceae bacterium]